MKSILALALESQLDENEVNQVSKAEDALVDVGLRSDDQEDCDEEVTEAIQAASSLEQILAAVEPAEGEVAPAGAAVDRILAVAVEQVFERLGHPAPSFIALEADGGVPVSSKVAQLKEFLIKMWRRIVEAFTSIYDAVSDFLSTAFNAAARLERAAIATLRESRKLNGPPAKSTYTNKDMARRMSGDDSVGIIKLFDRTLDLTELTVQAAYTNPTKLVLQLVVTYMANVRKRRTMAGAQAPLADYSELINKLPKALFDAYTGRFMNKDASPVQASDAPSGVDVHTTDILMGGVVAGVLIPQSVEDLNKFSFFIKPVLDDTASASELQSEVPVSDVRQQEQLLKMVIANCGQIRRFNKNLPDLKALDDMLKGAMNLMKFMNWGNSDPELEAAERAVIRTIAYTAPRIAQGIHQRTFAHALNASRTIIKHVQHSIEAYAGNEVKPA